MTFCEKCDALLVPKKINGKIVAVCQDCGWIEKQATEIPNISITDEDRSNDPDKGRMLILEESEHKIAGRSRKEMYCPRDENMQIVEYWEIQTRSADEAPTRFFRCTNCDKNWREYD